MLKTIDWSQNYIRDGYTQPGYIAQVERKHGALRFQFRPMLPEEVEEIETFRNQYILEPRRVVARIADECAKRITAWSEMLDAAPLEISTMSVRRIRQPLLMKLYSVISGDRASDEDPEYKDFDGDDFVALSSSGEGIMEKLGN